MEYCELGQDELKYSEIEQLRVAIIGCGCISTTHVAAIEASTLGKIEVCVDTDYEKASLLAESCGAQSYSDYKKMIELVKPDVVHICTPHFLHISMIEYVASKGIAVFTEKPPVISNEEFAVLEVAAEKATVGVCFQNRMNEAVKTVLQWQNEGKTGKPKGARAFVTWCRPAEYYTSAPWRGSLAKAGGGALINQALHTLDLLVQFLGAPMSVDGSMSNRHLKGLIEVEDTLEALINFKDCDALFYTTTAYCKDEQVLLEMEFEKVSVRIEGATLFASWKDGTQEKLESTVKSTVAKNYWGTGHAACVKSFYESVLSRKSFTIDPAGVKPTMQTMFALYESARNHEKIEVEGV